MDPLCLASRPQVPGSASRTADRAAIPPSRKKSSRTDDRATSESRKTRQGENIWLLSLLELNSRQVRLCLPSSATFFFPHVDPQHHLCRACTVLTFVFKHIIAQSSPQCFTTCNKRNVIGGLGSHFPMTLVRWRTSPPSEKTKIFFPFAGTPFVRKLFSKFLLQERLWHFRG
jgi:hypothetical protein